MITTKKSRVLSDIFKEYPYIKKHKPNQTRPSLKGCEINPNHELSLDWVTWRKVIKIYLKYVALYIMSGRKVQLPHRMGNFQMYKYKYKDRKRIDFNYLNKHGVIKYHNNNHTNGYGPIIKWNRKRNEAALSKKWYWGIKLSRTFGKQLSENIFSNPALLYSYEEAPKEKRSLKTVKS